MLQQFNLPSSLHSLLAGKVPDAEWEFHRTEKMQATWQKAADQWTYLAHHFTAASKNVYCGIPILPVLAWLTIHVGAVPALPTTLGILQMSPAKCYALESRAYQCFTGWLREVHVGLVLAQQGRVFKNPHLDVKHGVDWIFRQGGKETKIAIAHEGKTSKANWERRKRYKLASDAVVLTARGSAGLSLVPDSEILSAIKQA